MLNNISFNGHYSVTNTDISEKFTNDNEVFQLIKPCLNEINKDVFEPSQLGNNFSCRINENTRVTANENDGRLTIMKTIDSQDHILRLSSRNISDKMFNKLISTIIKSIKGKLKEIEQEKEKQKQIERNAFVLEAAAKVFQA